jgi:ATP-binding cassette subfamily B protein
MRRETPLDIASISWPLARLGEGIDELVRRARLHVAPHEPVAVPPSVLRDGAGELRRWIGWAADRLGLEAKSVEATAGTFAAVIEQAGPALLQFNADDGPRFLLLLRARRGTPQLVCPDLRVRGCATQEVCALLTAEHEAPLRPQINHLLALAQVPPDRARRVGAAIARERLATTRIGGCWMLRLPATTGFWHQLKQARVPHKLAVMLAVFVVAYALEIMSWTLVGSAALDGRLDLGWLAAWALLLLSMVPIRLVGGWFDAMLAIDASRLLKSRMLAGALNFDTEEVRRQGVGQLLGRVMDSQAFEALAVNGGLSAIVAVVELAFAAWVMSLGAGGMLHLVLLGGWLVVAVVLALHYFARLRAWTAMRLDMTHDLVERMVGHRTTLAQEWPARRDQREDQTVRDYLHASSGMDRAVMPFLAGVPSGWMVLGLAGLAPAFIWGGATPGQLAIGLGGVYLANRAFDGIAAGLAAAARAAIAWKQVGPLFKAAARPASTLPFVSAPPTQPWPDRGTTRLIDADGLVYRYAQRDEPVLKGASLTIRHGERLLVEGGSGGGKSTLASLLVGLRKPDAGLLLLNGLDRNTLGDAWHEFATEAPQFHENHILSGTLAFNLLMGRNWPATDEEIEEARALCVELGLGDLIARMPSGMMQTVGETGWQLSHGEKSRIFLARALLQDAQLTILDESFAALDPETLQKCLNCAQRRARTLMVIAHP